MLEKLLDKLPEYDRGWEPEVRRKWLAVYFRLCEMALQVRVKVVEPAVEVPVKKHIGRPKGYKLLRGGSEGAAVVPPKTGPDDGGGARSFVCVWCGHPIKPEERQLSFVKDGKRYHAECMVEKEGVEKHEAEERRVQGVES